ncbi:MAG: alpha/beta hydrolase [Synergistaceae bacterium]|nr:alpha/beta hydrolase [Synergistaceae bacterium]MBR2207583.1 alpha/beta hydrolase [Synergistaceae bacterium]
MQINFSKIPAVIYGEESKNVYIYVHGFLGKKEDAEEFSKIANKKGFQVLSFDLPGHGERRKNSEQAPEMPSFSKVVADLETIYEEANSDWKNISIYAVSLGAYFSLVTFQGLDIEKALLVSPVVNMKNLIERTMKNSGITPEILKARKNIPELNLSWDYYKFTLENEITDWNCKTEILYPERDNLTPRNEAEEFVKKFNCGLTVLPNGEHYIHTEEDLKILRAWEEKNA